MLHVYQQTSANEEISSQQWLLHCSTDEPLQAMIATLQNHGQKNATPGGDLPAVGGGQEGPGLS